MSTREATHAEHVAAVASLRDTHPQIAAMIARGDVTWCADGVEYTAPADVLARRDATDAPVLYSTPLEQPHAPPARRSAPQTTVAPALTWRSKRYRELTYAERHELAHEHRALFERMHDDFHASQED